LGRIFKLPVLRQFDGILGAVAGAAQGIVLAFVLVSVLTLVTSTTDNSDGSNSILTRETLDQTVIVSHMEAFNPAADLLGQFL